MLAKLRALQDRLTLDDSRLQESFRFFPLLEHEALSRQLLGATTWEAKVSEHIHESRSCNRFERNS